MVVFFLSHAAVFPLVHLHCDPVFSLDHATIRAYVDMSGLRVFRHHTAACADIAPAIQLMPDWGREPLQVDLFLSHRVFKSRPPPSTMVTGTGSKALSL